MDENLFGTGALNRLYEVKDSWLFLAAASQEEWEALCSALHRDDLRTDSRFATAEAREQNDGPLAEALQGVFAERTAADWESELTAKDIAAVRADRYRQCEFLNKDPHMTETEMSTLAMHPAWGQYRRFGVGVNFSLTPGVAGGGNRVGEHTQSLLEEMGYSKAEIDDLGKKGAVIWPAEAAAFAVS